MKNCPKCDRDRPLSAFTKNSSRSDGLSPWCSQCRSKYRKEEYLAAHPDRRSRGMFEPKGHAKEFKLCIDCLEEKPVSHFHRKRSAADGKTSYCVSCGHRRSLAWQEKNKDKIAIRRRAYRQKTPRSALLVTINGALKRRPSPNPVTIEYLLKMFDDQKGKCAVSGITMTWAQGKLMPASITMDRINFDLGYSIGNIRLVCHCVNAFIGRMSDEEMLTVAKAIVANMESKSSGPTWQPHLVHSEAA